MPSRIMPGHVRRFFEIGGEFSRHQDPGKFKMQLGQLETEVKRQNNGRGLSFIKKQKKILRF